MSRLVPAEVSMASRQSGELWDRQEPLPFPPVIERDTVKRRDH
jgi:hypothetical protein